MNGVTICLLIVDDDTDDRMKIRRVLAKSELSHALVEASNMDEALDTCEKKTFDAVIVDYNLPCMNGLGGIARLRERMPLLPIIIGGLHRR